MLYAYGKPNSNALVNSWCQKGSKTRGGLGSWVKRSMEFTVGMRQENQGVFVRKGNLRHQGMRW